MFTRTAAAFVCPLVLALLHNFVQAQIPVSNKPVITLKKAAPPVLQPAILPAAYSGNIQVNFIRSREALAPVTDVATFDLADHNRVKEATEYFDGLGRPLQTVQRQSTSGISPVDLVMPVVYDNLGREVYKYLPYAQTTGTNTADGRFKPDPFNNQQSFYQTAYRDAAGNLSQDEEQFLYSMTTYENSPLNRVSKVMAAGNSWAGSGRGTEKQYLMNAAADAIRIWKIANNPLSYTNGIASTNIPESPATYHPGELYKNVSKDEHGNAVVEYADKEGQIVLKKVQAGDVPPDFSGYQNWLSTYYVFDDFNRLRFVIPPKAVETIEGSWILSAGVVDELCFRYEYDEKQRLIAKKVPGAGWTNMVYDQRDRLVFSQDGNLRQKGRWMATLYDDMIRPIATGIMESPTDRDALQSYVNAISAAGSMVSITDLSPAYYLKVWMNPVPAESRFIALTVTHYDDYVWTNKLYTDRYNNKLDQGSNLHPDHLPSIVEQQKVLTRGMLTGTLTRVLEDMDNLQAGKWLSTTLFYDSKARVIQTQSENYGGGTDIVTNRYDFTGKNICTYTAHNSKQALPGEITTKASMDYDHAGRLLRIWKTVNDQDDQKTRIVNNAYDELGQLKTKELGLKRLANRSYSSLPLEKLNHTYNIRGWLKGINASYSNPALSAGMSQEHWFGMELNYDWGSEPGKNQFNGNISSATWKSKGDGISRAYGFSYDKANRLLGGDFSEYNGTAYTDNAAVNFDMVMGNGKDAQSAYDANGNIRSMDQWGMKLNTSVLMDKLSYRYKNGGLSNTLSAVSDNSPLGSVDNKLGDFVDKPESGGQVSEDYKYDVNGNLLYDKNKNIRSIGYNHLNLPQSIIVTNNDGTDKGKITYTYDASGNKLQKKVLEYAGSANNNQQKETVTIYLGAFVYEQSGQESIRLQYISHEEGRIRIMSAGTPITWNYDYFIKDHLGNTRMVLTDEQEQAAYPVASLEEAGLENEKKYYTIPDQGSRVHKNNVPGYPEGDSYTNPNNYIQKLNGNGTKIGTGIVLKVMSGDKVNIRASSWYRQNGVTPGSPQSIVEDIVASLAAGMAGGAAGKAGLPLQEPATLLPGVAAFLDHAATNTANTTKPKAYVNWLLLDEQLKPVITGDGKNSGFEQAGADQAFTIHQVTSRELTKNGYLYIYLSNATPNIDVFFDNLQVTHIKGPLLEETHYYPFGLTMAGISSRSFKSEYPDNKRRYNGIEFESDLDLNTYDAFFRELDPQTGRWWQIDPKTETMEAWSPYVSNYDNPVTFSDPLGDWPDGPGEGFLKKLVGGAAGVVVGLIDNALGSNIRGSVSSTISDAEIATGWNTGLDVADVGGIVGGISESTSGSSMVASSVAVTAASGGLSIEVTGPTAALGTGMAVHGVFVTKNGVSNLVSQNGRVNVQGLGEGRGKNDRKPDPKATGDHTVSNDRGSTTYKRNDRNPKTGFDEVKRVDTKGKADNGVPTPHVHEKGVNGARPAHQNEMPKTNLSKNKGTNE